MISIQIETILKNLDDFTTTIKSLFEAWTVGK